MARTRSRRPFRGTASRCAARRDRRGKTAGLNTEVPTLAGDIVVFSDANALYRADAIRSLVRNFADPQVGCVTGEARYVEGSGSAADVGEHAYWDYEMSLKRLETAVGSMVGGDGAIYAIRKPLWQRLPDDAINDFLNPLQIVAAGWRNVYEPEAVAFEETAGRAGREYRRRVRIVSRSWRAVFQAPGVLNPARVGLFSFCLLSHKVLRWWAPVVLLGLAAVAAAAAVRPRRCPTCPSGSWPLASRSSPRRRSPAGADAGAGFAGLLRRARGRVARRRGQGQPGPVSGVWAPPREGAGHRAASHGLPRTSAFLTVLGWLAIALGIAQLVAARYEAVAMALYGIALLVLAYVYVGYPALIGARALLAHPAREARRPPALGVGRDCRPQRGRRHRRQAARTRWPRTTPPTGSRSSSSRMDRPTAPPRSCGRAATRACASSRSRSGAARSPRSSSGSSRRGTT